MKSEVKNIIYKDLVDKDRLPEHIAIIMDGNGRWAKQKGKLRVFGHKNGVQAVREVTEACAEIGVKYLTLYAFSTENWNRPQMEVSALMELLALTIKSEIKTLQKNNIRLNAIGNIDSLPEKSRNALKETIEATQQNTRMTLTLALSYGSQEEITNAVKNIALDCLAEKLKPNDINPELIGQYLYTKNIPNPDLMIRTSGEHRVSNFLLWQLAYAEFYFTPILWPDYNKECIFQAIVEYQQRERRFGKTTEQIHQ